jgi:hypothetical protein
MTNATIITNGHIADDKLGRLTPARHGAAAAASFATLGIVNGLLNRLYEASNHPVSYAEGQTSFDATAIKGWYDAMSKAGTLDVYVGTQLFDFVFMAALALFALAASSVVRRLNGPWRPGMMAATIGGLAIVGGTIFDAVENLVSFVMLADADGFADWLALPYSGAAVIKFALIGTGFVILAAATATGIVRRLGAATTSAALA